MTAEIEVVGAVFRCETEREVFFRRLEEVAGLLKVVTEDNDAVILTVEGGQIDVAAVDVKAICDFWNASYRLRSVES